MEPANQPLPTHAPGREQYLVGQIGAGIGRSLAPSMLKHAFERCGVHGFFRQLDLADLSLTVDDLPRLLDACVLTGWRCIGITHPCKEAVVPLLHELDPAAQEMGSGNCVVVQPQNGRLKGYNLDWIGAAAALDETLGSPPTATQHDQVVTVVGAGGVARAVVYALLTHRHVGSIRVCDLVREKALALVDSFQAVASQRGAAITVATSTEAALVVLLPRAMLCV